MVAEAAGSADIAALAQRMGKAPNAKMDTNDTSTLRTGRWGGVDASSAAAGVVDDLALLGRCDAYVGKFTSNLDRIAYSLLAARSGCLKPVVSLDSLWCHDWSNRVGQSLFGSFVC